MTKRMAGVGLAVALCLTLAACSSTEMVYVPDGGTYTAVTVEELATEISEPSFMGEDVDNAVDLRTEQLTSLRAQEGSAAALADVLTNTFPADTVAIPYYAEEATVNGQAAWVVLEVWGSAGQTLDKQRLWVLRQDNGEIVLSSVFTEDR